MSEVIVREWITRDYICSRDTFLQMKADQKMIMEEVHTKERNNAHQILMDEWWGRKPTGNKENRFPDRTEWMRAQPKPSWEVTISAYPWTRRAINIIYGLVKGKEYKQIEQKCHEFNPLPISIIKDFCEHYGIDTNIIMEKIDV